MFGKWTEKGRQIGSRSTPSWAIGSYCGMAPMWPWWPPSSPVGSALCHILEARSARASTSPQRTASRLAMLLACPAGPIALATCSWVRWHWAESTRSPSTSPA